MKRLGVLLLVMVLMVSALGAARVRSAVPETLVLPAPTEGWADSYLDFLSSNYDIFAALWPYGVIYSKRFNPNTGAADYDDYALVVPAQQQQAAQPAPLQQQAAQPQQQPAMPEYVTVEAFHGLEGRVNEIGNTLAQWQSEQVAAPKKQAAKQTAKEE